MVKKIGELSLSDVASVVARALVDDPDSLHVREQATDNTVLIEITVPEAEAGRVIGRQGRSINALRHLLRAAQARHDEQTRVNIEVLSMPATA